MHAAVLNAGQRVVQLLGHRADAAVADPDNLVAVQRTRASTGLTTAAVPVAEGLLARWPFSAASMTSCTADLALLDLVAQARAPA